MLSHTFPVFLTTGLDVVYPRNGLKISEGTHAHLSVLIAFMVRTRVREDSKRGGDRDRDKLA